MPSRLYCNNDIKELCIACIATDNQLKHESETLHVSSEGNNRIGERELEGSISSGNKSSAQVLTITMTVTNSEQIHSDKVSSRQRAIKVRR